MAKTRSRERSFGVEFINVELTDEQEAAFSDWHAKNFPRMGELCAEFAMSGNKFGVSHDGDNECFIVSATCKDERQDNYNKCYTSRSDDWVEALMLCLFKWDVLFGRDTWLGKTRRNNWG